MRRRLILLALVVLIALPALAIDEGNENGGSRQDVVHFGSNVRIPAGQEAGDVVCFLCSVVVEGTVHKDIVVFLGSVRITGNAEHDVVVFGGSVSVGENSSIGHDIVIMGGERHVASTATIGHDSVVFPLIIIALPFLLLVGGILLVVRLLRWLVDRNRPVYGQPYP